MADLFFEEYGQGRPIIFLHGFCDTHETWMEFIQPLATGYRIILPDLPGFGKSSELPGEFTVDDVADHLAKWWMSFGKKEKPVIIGHSLGGYVALSIAARHKDMIAGLGLFHSTPLPDSEERKQIRNKVIRFVKENGVQPYVDTFVPGLFFDKLNPAISKMHSRSCMTKAGVLMSYASAMRDRPDRTAVLSISELPKMIIGGLKDSLIPIESLRELSKKAKNCDFFELENVGHMGFFEAKRECREIATRFADRAFSFIPI